MAEVFCQHGLDRDYMLNEEIDDFYKKAKNNDLELKIWTYKEIENYFIIPDVFRRIINRSCGEQCDIESINSIIEEVEKELEVDVILSFADVLQKFERSRGKVIELKTAYVKAKEILDQRVSQGEKLRQLASGKDVISRMSRKCQDSYGVSFSPLTVCKEARLSEISKEMKEFIESLCR